nr:hypothetical protein JVH1_3665 [Rhodococcus sp. JVH1]
MPSGDSGLEQVSPILRELTEAIDDLRRRRLGEDITTCT